MEAYGGVKCPSGVGCGFGVPFSRPRGVWEGRPAEEGGRSTAPPAATGSVSSFVVVNCSGGIVLHIDDGLKRIQTATK